VKTFYWDSQDSLIVVKAESVADARDLVVAKFEARSLHIPFEVREEEPTVLADEDVVWCWS